MTLSRKVIIEVGGERHELYHPEVQTHNCADCSFIEHCNKLNTGCIAWTLSDSIGYKFKKEK